MPDQAKPKLGIIVASVRQGRKGESVAEWFAGTARRHGGFEIEMLDLKRFDLPVLEEPEHPMKRDYHDTRVQAWSKAVAACDAFVIVTPEYNYSAPPGLINALDHLYFEWNYKPAGYVSYGGNSGGLRSVQDSKVLLATLKMMAPPEGVSISFDATGQLPTGEAQEKAAVTMLNELVRWTGALRTLRA